MNGGFVETLKVTDEWRSGGETFRLVDRGAGPRELQIERGGSWVAESPQYVHGVLCARIEFLANAELSGPAPLSLNKIADVSRGPLE